MTTDELNALRNLVAQFRRRSRTAETMRDKLKAQAQEPDGMPLRKPELEAERLEGKRQAYANDADDLERFIRTVTPNPARAGGK